MNRDDVLDQHVAAGAVEGHADLGRRVLGFCDVDMLVGILDVEERRHLRHADEAHRVLIEQAVAPHRGGGSERAAAEILDVVAFHHRRVGVHEEAPVRLVAPEQLVGAAARCGRGTPRTRASDGRLLPEHAQRVVLAEESLRRIVRVLGPASIMTKLRSRPALPNSRDASKMSRPMPRISLATVDSKANASRDDDGRIGPDHQLVVGIGMRAIERLGAATASRSGSPRSARRQPPIRRRRPLGAEIDRAKRPRAPRRDADDGVAQGDAGGANRISIEPSGSSVACADVVRVESNPRTLHHVTVY